MEEAVINKIGACKELPSIPAAASKILQLAQDPDSSLTEVCNAISLDPALSSKILRTANSPLYGKRQADTLNQAAVFLGMNALTTIALSFSLSNVLKRENSTGIDYEKLWRRTLLTAAIARVISDTTSKAGGEETFLAALLQDLGIMALDQAMPELYQDMLATTQNDHAELCAYEKNRIGCDHAEAGAWLLNKWHLPIQIVQAVELSHSEHIGSNNAENVALAQTVNVAALVADVLDPDAPSTVVHVAMAHAKRYWNVEEDWLRELQQALTQEIHDIEKLFETSLIECDTIDTLLTEARETLMLRSLLTAKRLEEEQIAADEIRRRANAAEEKSKRDALTGLYNREFAHEFMDEKFADFEENGKPLSVIFIDLDRFKALNDTYGHEAGDYALQHSAQILQDTLRDNDHVCRWGGEEFVVLLHKADEDIAKLVGERLVDAFRKHPMQHGGETLRITISAGAATLSRRTRFRDPAALVKAADHAMYEAKKSGRDQLACA
jgi:diguanylate cyclase (GGDEF)-like protein